jgi:hypothetical protein
MVSMNGFSPLWLPLWQRETLDRGWIIGVELNHTQTWCGRFNLYRMMRITEPFTNSLRRLAGLLKQYHIHEFAKNLDMPMYRYEICI